MALLWKHCGLVRSVGDICGLRHSTNIWDLETRSKGLLPRSRGTRIRWLYREDFPFRYASEFVCWAAISGRSRTLPFADDMEACWEQCFVCKRNRLQLYALLGRSPRTRQKCI